MSPPFDHLFLPLFDSISADGGVGAGRGFLVSSLDRIYFIGFFFPLSFTSYGPPFVYVHDCHPRVSRGYQLDEVSFGPEETREFPEFELFFFSSSFCQCFPCLNDLSPLLLRADPRRIFVGYASPFCRSSVLIDLNSLSSLFCPSLLRILSTSSRER